MFNQCSKLKEIQGMNKFNTSKLRDIGGMFQGCYELEYLDLSNFDTSNVTDMRGVFNKCFKLKEIKGIGQFKANKVSIMRSMFQDCYELENLDLSNFDTSNATHMGYGMDV